MLSQSDLDAIRAVFKAEFQAVQNIQRDEILGVEACAALLNVTRQTVYQHAKTDLPCTKIGKTIYFKRSDVDTFINENKRVTLKAQLEAYKAQRDNM